MAFEPSILSHNRKCIEASERQRAEKKKTRKPNYIELQTDDTSRPMNFLYFSQRRQKPTGKNVSRFFNEHN